MMDRKNVVEDSCPNVITLQSMCKELKVPLWKGMEIVKWLRWRIIEDLQKPYEERWKWVRNSKIRTK